MIFVLNRCNRITQLNLANTSITNNSVAIILEYSNFSLEKVDFTYTNIYFLEFLALKSMPKLKDLCCDHLETDEVSLLRKQLRHLKINEDYFDIASPRQSFEPSDGFWEI